MSGDAAETSLLVCGHVPTRLRDLLACAGLDTGLDTVLDVEEP